jgi:hypothetical protein
VGRWPGWPFAASIRNDLCALGDMILFSGRCKYSACGAPLRLVAGRAHRHERALGSAQPYEDLASNWSSIQLWNLELRRCCWRADECEQKSYSGRGNGRMSRDMDRNSHARHGMPALASGTLAMTGRISAPFGRPGKDSSTLRPAAVRKHQAAGIHHERADRMDAYPAAVRGAAARGPDPG